MSTRKKIDAKLESLKKFGSLNSRTEKVCDSLFQDGDFFDPRDLMQVKYEMLRRVSAEGWTISRASKSFGFSRPSFYEAKAEFEHAGLSGFVAKHRGPHEAHKLSGPVMQFIEEQKQKDSSLRTTDLIELVEKQFGFKVHRRSIERAFTRLAKKKQNK